MHSTVLGSASTHSIIKSLAVCGSQTSAPVSNFGVGDGVGNGAGNGVGNGVGDGVGDGTAGVYGNGVGDGDGVGNVVCRGGVASGVSLLQIDF